MALLASTRTFSYCRYPANFTIPTGHTLVLHCRAASGLRGRRRSPVWRMDLSGRPAHRVPAGAVQAALLRADGLEVR